MRDGKFHLHARYAFTMLEVLLAVMILGIGLIMVASIFPVAADWTRQNTEESLAAMIAGNAVGIVQAHCTKADLSALDSQTPGHSGTTPTGSSFAIQPLPATMVGKIPAEERAYWWGHNPPFPVATANISTPLYWWVPLIREVPTLSGTAPVHSGRYDLFILVFKKGAQEQTYTAPAASPPTLMATHYGSEPATSATVLGVPNVVVGPLGGMPVGALGIGQESGTVFRRLATNTSAVLMGAESVIYSPPADNTSSSALVYVYQTTVGF